MDNQEIIMTIGISGAGKSTWCTQFIKQNPNYYRVNRDSFRMMFTSSNSKYLDKESENLVTKCCYEAIKTLLLDGKNVIIDNTHLSSKYIEEIRLSFGHLADIKLKIFNIDLDEAKVRVNERDNNTFLDTLDLKYIQRQQVRFVDFVIRNQLEEEIYKKEDIFYRPKNINKICVICDLDGTLSLYGGKNPYERDFENDEENLSVSLYLALLTDFFNDMYPEFNFKIFFFSGRNEKYKDQTLSFLTNNIQLDESDFSLIMRKKDDFRRDSIIKMEMFDKYIRDQYEVHCVFDDRLQVIEECWNKLGVNVLNCNQNNKRF